MDLKSNEPFWLIKNRLMATYPSLHHDAKCDVLIVGGGITGSLIAHQCIKDGFETILIDKREISNGSSSATTSLLQYEIDTPLYKLIKIFGEKGAVASYSASSAAIDQLGKIASEIKSQAGFRKKQSLYFAARKKDTEGLILEFEARKKAGFEVSWMTAKDILEKYDLRNTYGGILSKQGASVDAFMLVHEILAYNIERKLKVFDKTELTNVDYISHDNIVTLNTGSAIRCKRIIYCVGYESTAMIKEKFVDLFSTYAIVSEANPELSEKNKSLIIWNTDDPYIYLRSTDDGRMLIGGEDEEFRNPQKRDALIARKEKKLINTFRKYFPNITFYSDFAWSGTFGETKDGLPYIGAHADFKNSYFVLGFGGNGITFSVIGMEMVSCWLRNRKHPLTPYFAFERKESEMF